MAKILSGTVLRDEIKEELKNSISFMGDEKAPGLAIIQVGGIPASTAYIKMKMKFGSEIGVHVKIINISDTAREEQVIDEALRQNEDPGIGGIIVQLPLPAQMDCARIIETIDPEKDVDGLHSVNVKKLVSNDPTGIVPATSRGVISLLKYCDIDIAGKKVLMIGRSNLVGKPTALSLLNQDATVTIAHHMSDDLIAICREADVIVTATGVPGLITKDHVKAGQVIIDVGITKIGEKTVGDVAFDEVEKIVGAITPVPGGVGPMTVASLFQNLLRKYT